MGGRASKLHGIVSTPFIVAAMLFVSAPLFVSGAREAFARVDRRYEGVARTLGDPPLRVMRRVTLPLAMRGLVASAVVMWARAVSEFGAIVILTYNPKTVSVLSYDRFTSFGLSETIPVAAALVLFALVPLVVLRLLRYERRLDQPWSSAFGVCARGRHVHFAGCHVRHSSGGMALSSDRLDRGRPRCWKPCGTHALVAASRVRRS